MPADEDAFTLDSMRWMMLLALGATVPGCARDGGSDCEPDPPCDVDVLAEFPTAIPLAEGTLEVEVRAGNHHAWFDCVIDETPACSERERDPELDGWEIDATLRGDASAPMGVDVRLDRTDDPLPGPSSISITVRVDGLLRVQITLGYDRQVVAVDGARCSVCSFRQPPPHPFG